MSSMSENQSHRLHFLHKAKEAAELAVTQAQLALAQAEAELGEAVAEPTQEACLKHSEERERHIKLRQAMSLLTCQHCHQCAFCEPKFDVCWTGRNGAHCYC